ncbi:MAG: cytochrome c biogenesis protein CcsA [Deltaproteobacteria bacterium]|nr:cytochrome c biogenesis protein CcsA [Deltaproteobacteria bacterium]MCL5277304.1 cytochrome c biogenesis protein CcsA [Deltaproteobacteria bacterium]
MLVLTIILYIGAMTMSIGYAFYRDRKLEMAARAALVLAGIVHTGIIFMLYRHADIFPAFSLKYAVFMFAWALAVGAILVSTIFKGTAPIIGFSTPLILVLIAVSFMLKGTARGLSPIFNTDIFPVHVVLSITSYGLFALSFISSIMYVFQETSLKHRRVVGITRWLPSLFILDDLGYKTLTIGLPLLTLGIITGALWANRAFGSYWNWDPKETWSLIIWLAYVFILHGRISLGWRGRKFAWGSIVCFMLVVFAFIGVNFIFKGYHNF